MDKLFKFEIKICHSSWYFIWMLAWLRAKKWRLQICARLQDFNNLAFELTYMRGRFSLLTAGQMRRKSCTWRQWCCFEEVFASVMCWSRDASCHEFPSRKEKETFDGTQQHAVNRPAHGRVSERERDISGEASSINKINARGRPNWIFPRHWRGIPRSVKWNPFEQLFLPGYISKWLQQSARTIVASCDFWKGRPEIKGWKLVLTHAGIVRPEKFEPRECTIGFYPALIPLRQLLNFFTHYIPLSRQQQQQRTMRPVWCGDSSEKLYALITISSWEKRRRG